jgi:hypothetical protein
VIDSAPLLADLKRELRALEADLRTRAEDESSEWGARLREGHRKAQARERTGLAWIEWRDGEVSQAAVAWIIATVFIRFAEDNRLLAEATRDGRPIALPWIAAPGDGLDRAVENESAFYAASPTMTSRDWLQDAFRTLADLPAGRTLVDPDHSAVWQAPISAMASDVLLTFFRRTTPAGALVHDFSDPDLSTRFLGDLYQDLSDYAKKTFALLQTPIFVEEFILDQTLTPAIAEFGLTGLKVIDPACGSGHFLLGTFDRLTAAWAEAAPGVDKGERVQRALDSINGVDLNPFAIAIARFRLTVAAIKAAGIRTLTAAPAFRYHLAIGDSLLGGVAHQSTLDLGDGEYFEYDAEDLREYTGILANGQYHVVVANPPYIQPPDAKLRDQYRALYLTCHGKYALSVPFMELLFRLAKRSDGASGAGHVGQITSNSFMKREFGKKLIEQFLSGAMGSDGRSRQPVELSHIIDTSGAYIPGHGTPTVILIGRPRRKQSETIRAVLGVRGEPGQPAVAADGLVWRDIVEHLDQPGYNGPYVSVAEMPREAYSKFPWSLSGGGTAGLKGQIESAGETQLGNLVEGMGFVAITGLDDFHVRDTKTGAASWENAPTRRYAEGESVRDWGLQNRHIVLDPYQGTTRWLNSATYWPYRRSLESVIYFGQSPTERGMWWGEYAFVHHARREAAMLLTFAFVATHNHFVLDRGGKVFTRTAPVIKLPEGATEDDHYDLLGVLNSSTACFWLKQVSFEKGGGGEPWEWRYEFTATKLDELPLPLPTNRSRDLASRLDATAQALSTSTPLATIASEGPVALREVQSDWERLGRELVALQEELDWRMYVAYGLADEELAPELPEPVPIEPNERTFEIQLAREIEAGTMETAWFARHGRLPLTDLPAHWPAWYRNLAERRLAATASNPALRILEQPEYKRRWVGASWDTLLADSVKTALLDRLQAAELWHDSVGRPVVRSAAQLADDLRRDEQFRKLLTIHTGSQDYDLTAEVGRLLAAEAVPGLAALRYKASGLEKFRVWERIWELQRAEDRGEQVTVPVPPKYAQGDFLKTSYWSARGKLDVPKERFVAFPGSRLLDDATELYGWAGWDHGERGQAVARLANDLSRAAAPAEQIIPLVGVLLEIEPWLKQWHDEIGARSGVSPAAAVTGLTTSLLARLGIGRDAVEAWRQAPTTRGRKSA